jgi:hypothetical protein
VAAVAVLLQELAVQMVDRGVGVDIAAELLDQALQVKEIMEEQVVVLIMEEAEAVVVHLLLVVMAVLMLLEMVVQVLHQALQAHL